MDMRPSRNNWQLWYAWFPVKPHDDGVHWLEFVWRRPVDGWPVLGEFRTFRRPKDKAREAARREI